MTIHHRPGGGLRGILVIHPGALGDVLLARPALLALRRRFPQHEIALLAGESVGVLLREAGEVDWVFPLESTYLSQLFTGLDSLTSTFAGWLRHCDLAFGWIPDTDGVVGKTLHAAGVERSYLKSASSTDLLTAHQSARYLEAIQVRGVEPVASSSLLVSSAIREQGKRILHGLNGDSLAQPVVIHPGSGSARKCLEARRLVPVIEWLSQSGTAPLLLEGPADREAVEQVVAGLKIGVPVIRGLDVMVVAGVLSHAKLYLGHDSGVTHLAAALSIPTIACFGPTSSCRWAPVGRTVSILSGAPCVCPIWSSVAACGEQVCLQIAPERIIEACRLLLVK